ncbi:DUF885 family protein [bacterium]|nr:DUF885 family protein [bacterium]
MRQLVIACLITLLAACGQGLNIVQQLTPEEVAAESARLTAYLDAAFEEELQRSPQWLTRNGRKEQYDKLDDPSEAAEDADLEWRRASVEEMKRTFDPARLDAEARTSFEVWELSLARAEEAQRWRRHRYIFARGGAHASLPNFMINFHRVDDVSDMRNYTARIRQIDDVLDKLTVRAKVAADVPGVRQPRFAYDQAIDEARRVITGAPFSDGPDSPLYADARSKITELVRSGKAVPAQAGELDNAVRTAMLEEMKPGYDRLIAWLEADRAKASETPLGSSGLPDGAAYYQAMLRQQTTTDLTADQIHELGLAEVARIHAEMEAIKQKVGFEGSLPEFFDAMRADKRFLLPNTDAGRAEYIAIAEGYIGAMKAKLPELFGRLPKADVVVRRVESFREEAGGAAHYSRSAPDGSRPGVFYAHLVDMNAVPTFLLEALTYHEAVPGHHMQIAIAQELEGLPQFRTQYGYTAYSEGWGLYSEALGKEVGFFQDPYSDFGRLSSEIWRAVRLVVDTGLHAKGWTQDQAIDYALTNSPRPEASVRSEMRRYLVNPGQATAYKIGQIRIQQLREEARTALGDRFDIRQFHDVVLGGGALPMSVLERRVRDWTASVLASEAEPT